MVDALRQAVSHVCTRSESVQRLQFLQWGLNCLQTSFSSLSLRQQCNNGFQHLSHLNLPQGADQAFMKYIF